MSYLNMKLNMPRRTPDPRDFLFKAPAQAPTPARFVIPTNVVLNQGDLGSCVSNAFCLTLLMMTRNKLQISRLMHYYIGRAINLNYTFINDAGIEVNGYVADDQGMDLRSAADVLKRYGYCKEVFWPYLINTVLDGIPRILRCQTFPSLSAWKALQALKRYKYTFFSEITAGTDSNGQPIMQNDLASMKFHLSFNKSPIIFGVAIYGSFMTREVAFGVQVTSNGTFIQKGWVPLPDTENEQLYTGIDVRSTGHCLTMIGYDDVMQRVICVNSWGNNWGDSGRCYIPYAYIQNVELAFDFMFISFATSLAY